MSGFFIFKKEIYYQNKNKLFGKGYKILCDLLYSSNNNLVTRDYFIHLNARKEGYSKMSFSILRNIIFFIFLYFIKKTFRMINRK
jgi:hypothetical protein